MITDVQTNSRDIIDFSWGNNDDDQFVFFRHAEFYDFIRGVSFVLFMGGIFMIPSYEKTNENKPMNE